MIMMIEKIRKDGNQTMMVRQDLRLASRRQCIPEKRRSCDYRGWSYYYASQGRNFDIARKLTSSNRKHEQKDILDTSKNTLQDRKRTQTHIDTYTTHTFAVRTKEITQNQSNIFQEDWQAI